MGRSFEKKQELQKEIWAYSKEIMMQIKDVLGRIALTCSKSYLRHVPGAWGKEWLWDSLCAQYVNWRDISLEVSTRFGLKMKCTTKDFIQGHIIYFEEWEPNLTAFLKRRLREGDTFIDVGANVGYFSLLAAHLVRSQGRVLAIEASPSIFSLLEHNLKLNGLDMVRAVNAAVADREGIVTIYKAGLENIGASTTLVERSHQTKRGFWPEAEVPCASLLSIASAAELDAARLIKIDVEGAEVPILNDILKNIERFHPDVEIIAEISMDEQVASRDKWQDLFGAFADAGFHAYDLCNDYSFAPYVSRSAIAAPRRIRELPTRQFDVVWSRRAAETI